MTEDHLKIISEVYKYNSTEFNMIKTIEELQELSLALTQKITKPTLNNTQAIIDEIGDVKLRLKILEFYYDKDKVDARIALKLSKWKQYLEHKKFKNI